MKRMLSGFVTLCLVLSLLGGCAPPAGEAPVSSAQRPAASQPQGEPAGESSGPAAETPGEARPPVEGDDIPATDYADPANWSILTNQPEMPVDVFCLYPTAYSAGEGGAPLGDITDAGMRAGADLWMDEKASAFETAGNFFAPYYRQLDAGWLLTQPREQQDPYIKGVPKTDAIAAFDYYINQLNGGRPFLIVSHSQGSTMNKEILFDYLKEHPEVTDRLVASYVIGYSVTQDELDANPHVPFAEGPDDTGVIISYNTEAHGADPGSTVWLEGSVAINPISWRRTGEEAPASENLGSLLSIDGELVPMENLADAAVDAEKGVVLCASVDIDEYSMPAAMSDIFPRGVYHGYDIPFYYYNLRQNAETRVAAFLAAHPEYA